MTPRHADQRVAAVIVYFENLRRDDLVRLAEIYGPNAYFKDPFNEVTGVDNIRRVFDHMFDALQVPRFVVHEAIVEGDDAFLRWDFVFRHPRLKPGEQCIRGGSQLRFGADGRIHWHRDWWDAAEELYQKLPLIGALMRWLKRRARS